MTGLEFADKRGLSINDKRTIVKKYADTELTEEQWVAELSSNFTIPEKREKSKENKDEIKDFVFKGRNFISDAAEAAKVGKKETNSKKKRNQEKIEDENKQ